MTIYRHCLLLLTLSLVFVFVSCSVAHAQTKCPAKTAQPAMVKKTSGEVEVLQSAEQWNEYQLADGRMLLLKTVLTGVQKLEGVIDPNGNPVYRYQTYFVSGIK